MHGHFPVLLRGRLIGIELRRHHGRSLALGLGLFLATTSAVVLGAGISQEHLDLGGGSGAAQARSLGQPDLIVRGPAGGLSAEQLDEVRTMPDVDVAAPLALVGYVDVPVGSTAPRPAGHWVTNPGLRATQWRLDAPADAGAPTSRFLLVGVDSVLEQRLIGLGARVVHGTALDAAPSDPVAGVVPALVGPAPGAEGGPGVPSDASVPEAMLDAGRAGGSVLLDAYLPVDADLAADADGDGEPDAQVRASDLVDGPRRAARSVQAVGTLDATTVAELLGADAPLAAGTAGVLVVPVGDVAALADPSAYTGAAGLLVSSIRVRVEGPDGGVVHDERVRSVAETVLRRTGLGVTVDGRPGHLSPAFDIQNAVMTTVVLLVALAFVLNAVGASLRTRRSDFSTLLAVGWRPFDVVLSALLELAVIAVPAGAVAGLVARGLSVWTGDDVSWAQAAGAVPVALALVIAGGAWPAWGAATTPVVEGPWRTGRFGRPGPARTMVQLAYRNVTRVRGRSAVAIASVATAAATMTAVIAVNLSYGGAVVGSLLGGPVAFTAGPVDVLATGALLVLGCIIVTDVISMSVRERRGELAAMRALGWSRVSLSRLVMTETIVTALIGGALGAFATAAALSSMVGDVSVGVVVAAAVSCGAGVGICAMTVQVPLSGIRGMTTMRVLGEEI